jgi:cellobiose phosphorylase
VGVNGRGESVWLAFFLAGILQDFASLLRQVGRTGLAAEYLAGREALIKAVNEHGWDGHWFRCATTDAGEWIGSQSSPQGRIYLNTQTWAILTGATTPERQDEAWVSVKRHLLSPWGPLLLAPAYSEPRAEIGYITRYSPGSRENGGVYMHAATWALAAACKRKDLEAVAQIWKSISPPLRAADAEGYRAEPYVLPGNVDGPLSDTPGKAGWTWYTGSAAWLRKVVLDWVLGLRAVPEGLLIDPCPPAELGAVEITRRWRGRDVRVHFDARRYRPGAAVTATIDGMPGRRPLLTEQDLRGPSTDVSLDWQETESPARAASPRSVPV